MWGEWVEWLAADQQLVPTQLGGVAAQWAVSGQHKIKPVLKRSNQQSNNPQQSTIKIQNSKFHFNCTFQFCMFTVYNAFVVFTIINHFSLFISSLRASNVNCEL